MTSTPSHVAPGVTLLTRVTGAASPAIGAAAVLFVTALTAAAAQISVPLPFTPVPFTFQPMVVLLGAAALGSRLGCAAQIVYVALGAAGLPVFAASAVLPQGVLRLLGPTGGYLLSYPLAAFVTGALAERGWDRRYLTAVLAMAAGLAMVFAGGVAWLALLARPVGPQAAGAVGFDRAIATGLLPFVPADLLKLALAAGILPGLWRLFGTRAGGSRAGE
jgi:biotin transport system substrate-specific component